jgi:hypothetical protein
MAIPRSLCPGNRFTRALNASIVIFLNWRCSMSMCTIHPALSPHPPPGHPLAEDFDAPGIIQGGGLTVDAGGLQGYVYRMTGGMNSGYRPELAFQVFLRLGLAEAGFSQQIEGIGEPAVRHPADGADELIQISAHHESGNRSSITLRSATGSEGSRPAEGSLSPKYCRA